MHRLLILLLDFPLNAVIGLPNNLFPTTSIPVAILIFDRSREKGGVNASRKDVLFIDASKDYQSGKNQNTLLDEHTTRILAAYTKRRTIKKFAHLSRPKELKENDFNLNIPRYVDTFEEEAEIDIHAVQSGIKTLEGELTNVQGQMAKILKGMKAN